MIGKTTYREPKKLSLVGPSRIRNKRRSVSSLLKRSLERVDFTISFHAFAKENQASETLSEHNAVEESEGGSGLGEDVKTFSANKSTFCGISRTVRAHPLAMPVFL